VRYNVLARPWTAATSVAVEHIEAPCKTLSHGASSLWAGQPVVLTVRRPAGYIQDATGSNSFSYCPATARPTTAASVRTPVAPVPSSIPAQIQAQGLHIPVGAEAWAWSDAGGVARTAPGAGA